MKQGRWSTIGWPSDAEELQELQLELGRADPSRWEVPPDLIVGGCFVCFGRGKPGFGQAGEPGWAGAAAFRGRRCIDGAAVSGTAGAPYKAGFLALREGRLLEAAVRSLVVKPDVILVNATGRDHPRQAGVALHLGAVLGLPSIGITNRPLAASGRWPEDVRGATSPLVLEGGTVGAWVRSKPGVRPLAVTAGWRVRVEQAVEVVLAACGPARTPQPLREARRRARTARGRPSPV